MAIEELKPLAYSLGKGVARRPDDIDDLVQVGLFAFHRFQERHPRRKVRNPFALARAVMQRAMWNYYLNCRGEVFGKFLVLDLGVPLEHTQASTNGDQTDLLEMTEYLEVLEQRHGRKARQVAESLLEPEDALDCISNSTVRRVLGIRQREWKQLMTVVRDFTRYWLTQ